MPRYTHGRHESGQNFLTDRRIIAQIRTEVGRTRGSIFEIGGGSGNLTVELEKLGRPLTVIEIDPRRARQLGGRASPETTVLTGDFMTYRLGAEARNLVGNLPFHQTTAMLRRIMHATAWSHAVLLTQWEVARRRTGVGGVSMMTAQWLPWYEFTLIGRVPRTAFAPMPGVDGGIFTIARRSTGLLPRTDRARYQHWAHSVFTARGGTLDAMLANTMPWNRATVRRWMVSHDVSPRAQPKDLSASLWAELFRASS